MMRKLFILIFILSSLSCKKKIIYDARNKLEGTYEIYVKDEQSGGLVGYKDTTYTISGKIKKPTQKDNQGCVQCSLFYLYNESKQIILSTPQFTYYMTFDADDNSIDGNRGKFYQNGFEYHLSYSSPGAGWRRTIIGIRK